MMDEKVRLLEQYTRLAAEFASVREHYETLHAQFEEIVQELGDDPLGLLPKPQGAIRRDTWGRIQKHLPATVSQLAAVTQTPPSSVYACLRRMREQGVVVPSHQGRGAVWSEVPEQRADEPSDELPEVAVSVNGEAVEAEYAETEAVS